MDDMLERQHDWLPDDDWYYEDMLLYPHDYELYHRLVDLTDYGYHDEYDDLVYDDE